MIIVENTKNLLGVRIKGDYQDLDNLHSAIGRLSDLYFTSFMKQAEYNHEIGEMTDEEFRYARIHYSRAHECILGLNYDIRHAFQGDRNTEYMYNNSENIGMLAECIYEVDHESLDTEREKGKDGNLYFSVEILYPWALYYSMWFGNILDNFYTDAMRAELDFEYPEITYRIDEAQISLFNTLFWKCVIDALGKKGERMFQYLDLYIQEPLLGDSYMEAFCEYYCDEKKTGKKIRKAMLTALGYEFAELDERNEIDINKGMISKCIRDRKDALKTVKEETGEEYLDFTEYMEREVKYFGDKDTVTYEERESFMNTFGQVNWERLKW